MENIQLHIEAIIFSATQPVSSRELYNTFVKLGQEIEEKTIIDLIVSIEEKYKTLDLPFQLQHSGGGYQFLTTEDFHETIASFLNQKAKKKLSNSAMETLSIIAYKQPVTKSEIEQIRGVNSDYSVHKLLEKELISVLGRADSPGKPVLYGVSPFFLDYFGINTVEELPQLKEITPQKEENEVGEREA